MHWRPGGLAAGGLAAWRPVQLSCRPAFTGRRAPNGPWAAGVPCRHGHGPAIHGPCLGRRLGTWAGTARPVSSAVPNGPCRNGPCRTRARAGPGRAARLDTYSVTSRSIAASHDVAPSPSSSRRRATASSSARRSS